MLWFSGEPEQARKVGRDALALASRLQHPFTAAQVQMYVAMVHAFAHRWAQASSGALAAMALSKEHGFPQTYWLCSAITGRARVAAGEHGPGLAQLEESIAARKSIVSAGRLLELALLAEACAAAGAFARGLAVVDEAIDFAASTGEAVYLPEAHRLNGELLLRRAGPGDIEAATACFARAIELARAQASPALELRALVSLAQLQRATTVPGTETAAALARVYARFGKGHGDPDLLNARALLQARARSH